MAKLAKYLLITSGLLVLFYFGGVVENNGTSTLLNLLLSPENLTFAGILSNISTSAMLGMLAATGIIIAGLAYQRPDMVILGPVSLMFFDLIMGIVEIYNKIVSISPAYKIFGVLLFGPVLVLLFMIILDWWRGQDV